MKYSINAQGVPEAFGPYSQGTTAGRLVFAAGQLPIAEGQTDVLVEGGITEQAAFNEVYAERFGTPAPPRSVVAVADIPLGALVEMDCVACR